MHSTQLLCPQVTLGSQAPWRFINILYIHTSYYYRVNYGKEIPNTACCCVTCNCQSRLSAHARLNEYVKSLSWKVSYLFFLVPVPLLAWPTFSLKYSFCSFLNKLVFATCKTSHSSLCPYQEPRPTKEGPHLPSPNPITLGVRRLYWPGEPEQRVHEVTKSWT